ncbi:MAG: CsiV family protein [Gammaproteobacteria bacterium]|nr:CsiV family protein [Gammaproteobacteria bacterium]
MPKSRLFAAIVSLSCVFAHSAADPRIYLENDWYVLEIVVFERNAPSSTNEQLIHGIEVREFPHDLRSLSPSEFEQIELETLVQRDSGSRSSQSSKQFMNDRTGDAFSSEFETHDSTNAGDKLNSVIGENIGCWLHHAKSTPTLDLRIEIPNEHTEAIDSDGNESLFGDDLSHPIRSPQLPDWLPDDWETNEVILQRIGRILGLCDEDLSDIIAAQESAVALEETIEEEPLTGKLIEDEFAIYERELRRTSGTRRNSGQLSLVRAANRLLSDGYRIIDHTAWHQDALARGSSKKLLVQFGERLDAASYELEGTVELSSARFLHISLNVWKAVNPSEKSIDSGHVPRLLFYSMKESRRLTLGQTHYFDHPKFGILVRVQRLAVPERLTSLLDQLDNTF